MTPVHLTSPHYLLGEIEQEHHEIPGFAARAREHGMQPDARLWGWGKVHRTERPLEELVVETGKTIIDSTDVDLLVLCSTRFPGDAYSHGRFMETVMNGLGLNCAFLGLTLNRCTNLVSGLGVAEAFVRSGAYRDVLVITADRSATESSRVENFALFSDGAAGCLVTARPGDYEILGSASAQDARALDWGNEISADLSRQVNDILLTPHGLTPGDLAGVLHTNLYIPIVAMKERLAGFTPAQLDTANTARTGHCFAADPLINLADRRTEPGGYYLLAASVPGSRAAMLLRRNTPRP
ncbi:3-oxoacyl-ACP synthase [Streptomyces ipomoeae]|uniref:3-oxoacyl-ACP synthase n=1 Tax=Streptomyces ipomoeae TaxID=103232 RepID=UPI0011470ABC|nr:3-oxoacyl-ACP synthase [Streptomyces ipomoeae]MDX2934492.1 3-oxoacyl-ACP synthase [Streptomyces ipomoeae]TQE17388.1 3-oxoacyl-ACP synthase [Streptomyces ipomoeae]